MSFGQNQQETIKFDPSTKAFGGGSELALSSQYRLGDGHHDAHDVQGLTQQTLNDSLKQSGQEIVDVIRRWLNRGGCAESSVTPVGKELADQLILRDKSKD
jgi:hypothetical protein